MEVEVKKLLDETGMHMEMAIAHLETELLKIRAGKASPAMLEGIHVDYYGTSTPLNQVANVSTPDARTLMVQPWEKSMIHPIEKAITNANLGLNPQNDGIVVRMSVPVLTEERRKDLVKKTKAEGEHAKVTIRNVRRDTMELFKGLIKQGLPEDIGKDAENKVQAITNNYIAKVDKHLANKETEIMTV
jgi:ribosome recycling factor